MRVITTNADSLIEQEAEINRHLATQSRAIEDARAMLHPAAFEAIAERAYYKQQAEVLESKAHAREAKVILDQIRQR